MFLLFGTTASEQVLVVVTFVCEYCGQHVPQRVIKQSMKFSLFFIPLFTISKSFYVECSNCGGATALTQEQATHGLEWAERNRQVQ